MKNNQCTNKLLQRDEYRLASDLFIFRCIIERRITSDRCVDLDH